jgi:hypothetical protein
MENNKILATVITFLFFFINYHVPTIKILTKNTNEHQKLIRSFQFYEKNSIRQYANFEGEFSDVAKELYKATVMVSSSEGGGSGIVFVNHKLDGVPYKYLVVTAYHVVEELAENKHDSTEFYLIKDLRNGSDEPCGTLNVKLKYIKGSKKLDIAFLEPEVADENVLKFLDNDLTFSTSNEIPSIGRKVINGAYYYSSFGDRAISISEGQITGVNAKQDYWSVLLDKVNFEAYPGSSGSGVFNKNKELIGILVGGYNKGDNANYIVPIRFIIKEFNLEKYNPEENKNEIEMPETIEI